MDDDKPVTETAALTAAIREAALDWIGENIALKADTVERGICLYSPSDAADFDALSQVPLEDERYPVVSENMDHLVGFCAGARWMSRRADSAAWNSVDDRLPEVGALVMLFAPMVADRFSIGYCGAGPEFTSTGAPLFISSHGAFQKSDVTHWRPLPAPPETAR